MKLRPSNTAQFDRLLERLGHDVIDASIHYQLHAKLRKAIRSFTRELNQSPAFWTLTLDAHYDAFRARLFRAYDSQKGSLSLLTLLETVAEKIHTLNAGIALQQPTFASSGTHLRPSILGRDRRLVSDRDPLVKKLLSQRHNLFAHSNADNVMRQLRLEQRFALTYRELATLTRRAVRIINRYSGLFRRTTWSTRMVGADDYRNVLLAVRAEIERREQEFRREMRGYRQRRRPRA